MELNNSNIFDNMILQEVAVVSDIPHMLAYRRQVFLPREDKEKRFNQCIILNSPDIDTSISFMNHPMFKDRNVYHSYYMDWYYKERFETKKVIVNYRTERKKVYDKVMESNSNIQTYIRPNVIKNRNLYFDLFYYNQLFFSHLIRKRLEKRIEYYFNYLNRLIHSESIESYQYTKDIDPNNPKIEKSVPEELKFSKMKVVIDIDAWDKKKVNEFDNPIMYFYMALRKYFYNIKRLPNIDIIFYTKSMMMRINPAMCTDKSHIQFKNQLKRLYKTLSLTDSEIDKLEMQEDLKVQVAEDIKDEKKEDIDDIKDSVKPEEAEDIVDNVASKIVDNKVKEERKKIFSKVSKKIEDESNSDITIPEDDIQVDGDELFDKEMDILKDLEDQDDDIPEVIIDPSETDKLLADEVSKIVQANKVGKTTASLERDRVLREKQREIKFKGKTIQEILEMSDDISILEPTPIELPTSNENMKQTKFNKFEKTYNQKLMAKDTINIITNLNNKSIPTYVKDIKVEDTSDPLTAKETYTITLEDEQRRRHTLKVDIPKFIDDRYLYMNGNFKIINKQLFPKPIIKIGKDKVQVCSNYNKILMTRYGKKMAVKLEKFKKLISSPKVGLSIYEGDNTFSNNNYATTMEYDELASNYNLIQYKNIKFLFNQKLIHRDHPELEMPKDSLCIGFIGTEPIFMDYNTGLVLGTNLDLVDYMVQIMGLTELYDQIKVSNKNFMYTRATIMHKDVPIILLLGYCEGLTTVLKKNGTNYRFSDKREKINDNEAMIKFADGYLIYERYPFDNSLLLNGLNIYPTEEINFSEMDDKGVYIDIFESVYGVRKLYNAFDSFYEFMIDPITRDILNSMDYPTDFVSVILTGNKLLVDNSYLKESDMNLYRVRSNEVINAMLHRHLADAYATYRVTAMNKNPKKISIPRDAIMKQLATSKFVKEHSKINPAAELDELREVSMKGLNGMNLDQAYKTDKRAYDKTMMGIIGVSSSPDANVGVVKHMVLEPNIINARGFMDIKDDDMDSINDVNLSTPAEMVTPMSMTNDYSFRTATSSKQTGHIIPIAKSSPVLISNGMEQIIPQYLGKDFVITAEENGQIIDYDADTGIYIAKYASGKIQAIETKTKMVKNSSSGIYLTATMTCKLRKGSKFKQGDILAYNDKFFSENSTMPPRMNLGSLQKVAIMSSYATYEDSAFTTNKVAKDMSSEIVIKKRAILGKNANIGTIANVGDNVSVGDYLLTYETSYDEEEMNSFLRSIGEELREEIISLGKIPIKSKYTGEIVDIRIYSSVELSEMSPSLQKICKNYYKGIAKKNEFIRSYDKSEGFIAGGILLDETTGKIQPDSRGKVQGVELDDGLIIDFYIKYNDLLNSGDKIVYYSALKATLCEIIPENYEGYTLNDPDEEVSSFIGPSSMIARMTQSIYLALYGNKVLINLKRKLEDIYNS